MKNSQHVSRAAEAARETLKRNHRSGYSTGAGLPYDYTCPSPETYPFQWAWDSSYHAIALLHLDTHRSRTEISSLVSATTPAGFLPHMVLWQDDSRAQATAEFRIDLWQGWRSVTIAPPVLARAIERVFEATGDADWLAEVLPPALAFFSWLAENRTSPQTGLLEIYQPDESGLDMSPKYDRALGIHGSASGRIADDWHQAMRGLIASYAHERTPESRLGEHRTFVWNDVLVNTVYADGLLSLSRLALAARLPRETSDALCARSKGIAESLLRHCWDDAAGAFFDLDLVAGKRVDVLTASALFPLVLDAVPDSHAERLIKEHLLNKREFWHRYPVSSVAATEPSFDPDFSTRAIFRGSSWLNLNWYLYWGLRGRGHEAAATALAEQTVEFVANAGMRECYGPHDAAGHGARSFGWSSLVLDLIHAENL
ncbi:trehalase family glycosidase [Kitasatospora sp. NBC_01250]|uniref:MGH1-like glycoside hydrolase domain-containing protein n=1 Tax=unclassified Kitasatospora TaxID=2633591 RepID=UPI002E11FD42|nr:MULTISPECIES: trehalase family glycosidase [unclassified Kitasatospora]WSJ71079.1 trehalase family glycosidase [Kitasatospora sp. NBC_01302]